LDIRGGFPKVTDVGRVSKDSKRRADGGTIRESSLDLILSTIRRSELEYITPTTIRKKFSHSNWFSIFVFYKTF